MGEAEINSFNKTIAIHSHIITYGNVADNQLTELIRDEIETMWNESQGVINIKRESFLVRFHVTAICKPVIDIDEIVMNTDARNNYFRIEEYARGNISFVDALGCNTGYFMLENLYKGSTTAAHEYGHTLGLEHPNDLDIRGKGIPAIMYPRGTLVDPQYQYEPTKPAGVKGGTMHPMYRKVFKEDIEALRLEKLRFKNNKAVVGDFTNVYHQQHERPNTDSVLADAFQ
jgi:hypothetical protein